MDALNSEFRRLLVNSGWTQARAAGELRLDATTVSRYVTGDVRPSQTVLRLFSELIREPLAIGGQRSPIQSDYWRLEHLEQRLIGALRSLPPDLRRRLIDSVIEISDVAGLIRSKGAAGDSSLNSERIDRAAEEAVAAGVEILQGRSQEQLRNRKAPLSSHPEPMPTHGARQARDGQRSAAKSGSGK